MSLLPLEHFTGSSDPQTLANALLGDFTATRDGSDPYEDNSSIFSYKESSPGSEWYGSATQRGHLRNFTPSCFGMVKSMIQLGEAYIVRLVCPDSVPCSIKATYTRQLRILEEILVSEMREGVTIMSSWFRHEDHVADDVEDGFYVELSDPENEWELSADALTGMVLGIWVTLHRRDVDLDSGTRLVYGMRSDFFSVVEEDNLEDAPQTYACDSDVLPCRYCGFNA